MGFSQLSEDPVKLCLALILALLITGSCIRLAGLGTLEKEKRKSRLGSLATWWLLFIAVALGVIAGREVTLLLLALATVVAVREFLRLERQKREQAEHHAAIKTGGFISYAIVLLAYAALLGSHQTVFTGVVPVAIAIAIPIRFVLAQRTHGFMGVAGSLQLGDFLMIYCLGHAGLLLNLPDKSNPVAGNFGWLLFLLLVTEINDIAQAIWGRRFGKTKIAPEVSPNKTVEGFLLGLATTVCVAVALGSLLTPMLSTPPTFRDESSVLVPFIAWPVVAGLLIGIAGLLGDLTISAIKRDVGVKDSGELLPGQGGMLDRMDSLTMAAPVFYYFVFFLYS